MMKLIIFEFEFQVHFEFFFEFLMLLQLDFATFGMPKFVQDINLIFQSFLGYFGIFSEFIIYFLTFFEHKYELSDQQKIVGIFWI